MAYYYNAHIRNLEEESLIEKQKIFAELYQKDLLQSRKEQKDFKGGQQNPLKRSRKQDRQTAAFLERSRLSAELSASRIKAENSMTRSRLEAAFHLRKQNQKAQQKLEQINYEHEMLKDLALKKEIQAHRNFVQSQRTFNERAMEEDLLRQKYLRQIMNPNLKNYPSSHYYGFENDFVNYYG